jgi:hypothetical protein
VLFYALDIDAPSRSNEVQVVTPLPVKDVLAKLGDLAAKAKTVGARRFLLSLAHHVKNGRRWEFAKHNMLPTGLPPDELEQWVDKQIEERDDAL